MAHRLEKSLPESKLKALPLYLRMLHLYEASNRLAISGYNVLLVCMHDAIALRTAQVVLRQMQIDLITIKVRIEGRAICIVHANHTLTLHSGVTLRERLCDTYPQCLRGLFKDVICFSVHRAAHVRASSWE